MPAEFGTTHVVTKPRRVAERRDYSFTDVVSTTMATVAPAGPVTVTSS